jgi:hypothetical protein
MFLTRSIPSTHFTPRRYNPYRVLADSSNRLQPTLSLALLLQFLTPSLSASLITPSIHLRFGLPTRLLPSGLSKVIFLRGRLSSFHTICPAHLSLDILIAVTKSISSYRRYSISSTFTDNTDVTEKLRTLSEFNLCSSGNGPFSDDTTKHIL